MERARSKTVFVCQQCGKESLKWLGRCPSCHEWNTFVEIAVSPPSTSIGWLRPTTGEPQELSRISAEAMPRLSLPMPEFDRVLGGGLVPGSLVLIGGDPGIGKSTLLLQVSSIFAQQKVKVAYISGEESLQQIRLRADRLGVRGEGLYLLAETDILSILQRIQELSPQLVVIDSIQAIHLEELGGVPGSVAQVRECTLRLMRWAKGSSIPTIISGHVTKDGSLAGPRTLEHIVDAVLYLEGESFSAFRLLRSVKNRFGSTNEVGVFEMRGQGLVEVDNPSQVFLSQREGVEIGATVVPIIEGTRPLLVEIQALTNPTSFGLPRRTANGVDFNRLLLVIAVLSKQAGLSLAHEDIITNVTGGLRVSEPAIDLGLALAIASSVRNVGVDPELAAMGEVGLSGELRAVSQPERRVAEAARLGFKRCLIPTPSSSGLATPRGIKLIPQINLREALRVAIPNRPRATKRTRA